MKDSNIYCVGFILSLVSADCEITIFRRDMEIVTDMPKKDISYRHYGRRYREFYTNDGEMLKDTATITIKVY